ncbi:MULTISPECIES: 3-isopropylmalate dehydratase large subunit [unclassified Fictibacillus]|uniref:3-isopropylmalate dehydratase large subunit n=1 Tax=unclassified Fictibacillus TaxID=2644029 RepID=UPI00223CC45E|nr:MULTISPECIES: 3-isopropylmalate dehydratase large subunit [unclassified Fictibacillus]MED2972965.1 3-isopropylmalate dehydratase large subunit [Fictibacillus sp. B-59209]UZJ80385.1 3-isopropylmalate dehydratase large subunit [Fictibacillus sp. KU28468]
MAKTIIDKIWDNHAVIQEMNKPALLYIDLHLLHEVTSPQAFAGLREKNRKVRKPGLCFATMDHNIPTKNRFVIDDRIALKQIQTLEENCKEYGIHLEGLDSADQGIVHVIGPELGLTVPGKTIVCGDSHTSTHGAFGALAFGIGTSEVEHVLATQTLWQQKPKQLKVNIEGKPGFGVTAKDIVLALIASHGTNAGAGHVIEFTGETVRNFTMEERMTLCNMSIEAGAKAGLIEPDETTYEYIRGRKYAPKDYEFEEKVKQWEDLKSDSNASYDKVIEIDASEVEPMVTWGTNPSMGVGISENVPSFKEGQPERERESLQKALAYMGLAPGQSLTEVPVQHVFIGSCTNSRLSDLKAAAQVIKGKKVHAGVNAIVVPGSQQVKVKAEEEGLHHVFQEAGFEWRDSGCSMCLGMNPDIVPEGERCASTSNRNFEGRQGKGARTHLVSPAMAAAAAIEGKFVDVRKFVSGTREGEAYARI